VNIAGGDITAGDSSATQDATSESEAKASNDADTTQKQDQEQNVGSDCGCGKDNHKDSKDGKDGRDGKDGHDCGCDSSGSGGDGGFQIGVQKADTDQKAFAAALSLQNAVNSNTPHSVAGGNIYDGPSSANQYPNSEAKGKASNDAETKQSAWQNQFVGVMP
jgi:hypothetical protein